MCVHINILPDDCLLPIFDGIPQPELLCLDQVCIRWAKLLPSAAARRRTLVLILGGRRVYEIEWHIPLNNSFNVSFYGGRPFYYDLPKVERDASVTVPFLVPQSTTFEEFLLDDDESGGFFDILYREDAFHLEEDFTEKARFNRALLSGQLFAYFSDLLPNVHKLVVIHSRFYENEHFSLIDLLASSSWSLVTLKLWLHFVGPINHQYSDHPEHHPVRTLLQAIANQSSLEQLTLDLDDGQPEPPEQVFTFPTELHSFVGQIKVAKLFIQIHDQANLIWNTIHCFNSPVLSEISFGKDVMLRMDVALNPRFKFTPKVRQLYFWHLQFESVEQFDEFCWRFPSLTMLQMFWTRNITFTRLVSNLVSLKELTHLLLFFTSGDQHENLFGLVDGDTEEEARQMSLTQVKILELSIFSRSHQALETLSPLMFPSVEVIIVRNYPQCTICRNIIGQQYNREVANRCHRSLLRSLRNMFSSPLVRIYAKDFSRALLNNWTEYVHTEEDDALPGDEVGA